MEYRQLGKTGLKVSVVSYGNWLNSDDPKAQERTTAMVKKAYSLGINFFDTAELYGYGEGEKQLGVALKELNVPRENLVISSKIFWGDKDNKINQVGLSRKHIIEGVKNSLKRMQLEYFDVVFCHRFDPFTPVSEVCGAFNDLVRQGLVLYWGTSEWNPEEIFEAREACAEFNLVKPVAE